MGRRAFPSTSVAVRLGAALFVALVLVWVPAPALAQGPPTGAPGHFIVLFRDGKPAADRAAAVGRAGAALRFNYRVVDAAAVHVASAAALAALQSDPDVVAIVPDRPVYAHGKPTDVAATGSTQVAPAGVTRIGAPSASSTATGTGVGVAVLDTGIDFNHPDLQPLGTPCFTAFTACQDDQGHGTHVAGIIAARDNSIDVVGVAPGATLYAVKVLDQTGSGSDATIIAGLDWVYQNASKVTPQIRVVNMSLGRPGTLDDDPALRKAVQTLYAANVAVVVSAGNDATKQVSQEVPATYPEVMAIASTTAGDGSNAGCKFYPGTIKTDTASYFTTDGAYNSTTKIGVTISAPGEDRENISKGCFIQSVGILSTRRGGGTTRMSGTSMSAPHVTGVVALMWQKALGASPSQTLTPESARSKIRGSAFSIGVAPGNSPSSSYTFDGEREGIVSAPGALQP